MEWMEMVKIWVTESIMEWVSLELDITLGDKARLGLAMEVRLDKDMDMDQDSIKEMDKV